MHETESHGERWSISFCSCSQDTIHFHYGTVILHIALEDLRDLGAAMQRIAEGVAEATFQHSHASKKDLVQ